MNIWPPTNSEDITASLQAMQRFSHHDAHAKEIIDLIPRQPVWVQDPHTRTWYEGTIVSKTETPRSYIVQIQSGIVRRNRIQLRKKATNSERSESGKVTGKVKGSVKGTSYAGKCK